MSDPAGGVAALAKWYDGINIGMFADAHGTMNWMFPTTRSGANFVRAYDQENGFGLAWAGLNATYAGKKVGATIHLRFGQGPNQGWADGAVPGSQHVTQGFVTWAPHKRVSFDGGRFNTVYGAEVAESWLNHNYTRGALYNLAQPFWHTGLRVNLQLHDLVSMKFLVVNGWNTIVDNNVGKTVGAQIGLASRSHTFNLAAGYLGGPEHSDTHPNTGDRLRQVNRYWRHLMDVVATANWKRISVALNLDYIYDGRPKLYGGNASWVGFMGSTSVMVVSWFHVGARGEMLSDPDAVLTGTSGTYLGTGTGTLDFRPNDNFTLRLEGRYDGANNPIFAKGSATSLHQFTTTIGVVVRSF